LFPIIFDQTSKSGLAQSEHNRDEQVKRIDGGNDPHLDKKLNSIRVGEEYDEECTQEERIPFGLPHRNKGMPNYFMLDNTASDYHRVSN